MSMNKGKRRHLVVIFRTGFFSNMNMIWIPKTLHWVLFYSDLQYLYMPAQTSRHCAHHSTWSEADLDHQDSSTVTTHGANPLRAPGYLWTEGCSGKQLFGQFIDTAAHTERAPLHTALTYTLNQDWDCFTWEHYINVPGLQSFHAIIHVGGFLQSCHQSL